MRITISKNIFKMFTICAVAVAMFLFNSSNVWSRPAFSLAAKCESPGPKQNCGACSYRGLVARPPGSGGILCEVIDDAIDAGLNSGFTSSNILTQQTTSVFFPDNGKTDDTVVVITGRGYIGATVMYNQATDDGEFANVYLVCNAIKITDFDEWLAVAECFHYQGDKATVFPNPTSGTATVTLDEDYINFCKVQSVRYRLYNSKQALLTTFEPSEVDATVTIPAHFISNNGTYFIKCDVVKENTALNEEFTLQFMVVK